MTSTLSRRLTAEFIGTFWLVLIGCGSAVLAATFPDVGIGLVGVSMAFGLAVLTMAYAFGHISGGHFNPAVSLGLVLAKRLPPRDLLPYVITQVVAAVAAAAVLYVVASGAPGFSASESGFAANGYGDHSPGGYSLLAGLVIEVVMTAFFLLVILGATDRRAAQGFGPIAIGLALVAIHLVSIPVTNTSANPARSTGQAIFVGGWALSQLWLFWLAPLMGGAIAGLAYRFLTGDSGTTAVAREGQPVEDAVSDAHDAPIDLTTTEDMAPRISDLNAGSTTDVAAGPSRGTNATQARD